MDERTRKLLEEEKDPRVLVGLIEAILADNRRLQGVIDDIERDKAERAQQAFNLEEKLKLLRRSIFGRSSEKRAEASDRARDQSQEEALLFSQLAFPSPNKRDGKKNDKDLEAKEFEHRLTAEELTEESKLRELSSPSSEQWVETSFFDEVTRIQVIERKYVKEIHRKFKHKLKPEFNPTDKDIIVTANAPPVLLPGMNYTTEFVASVIADKYISHMPLERQTREMESLGLKGMKTSTLSRLSALGAASFEPLQDEILKELLKSDLALHLDETPWKIQVQQDGYMWVVSNRYSSYYFLDRQDLEK
jgi:transposase